MNQSIKGKCGVLAFWPDNKSLEQICKDVMSIDLKPSLLRRMKQQTHESLDLFETEEPIEWEEISQ